MTYCSLANTGHNTVWSNEQRTGQGGRDLKKQLCGKLSLSEKKSYKGFL